VAYKKDIDDVRESPALHIIERLQRKGAKIRVHDPYVAAVETPEGSHESVPLTPEALRSADAVLVLTDHTCVEYDEVLRHASLVVDTRNAFKGHDDPRIVRL